jgi:hypothetical protein
LCKAAVDEQLRSSDFVISLASSDARNATALAISELLEHDLSENRFREPVL